MNSHSVTDAVSTRIISKLITDFSIFNARSTVRSIPSKLLIADSSFLMLWKEDIFSRGSLHCIILVSSLYFCMFCFFYMYYVFHRLPKLQM